MRVSVVTPNFNMAPYLQKTMESVIANLEPGDEYFVIDGGSTDGSVELIRQYESRITGWVSERDHGYGDAIAKGFAKSAGDILCWINSGDLHLKGTIARARQEITLAKSDLIFGDDFYIDEQDRVIQLSRGSVGSIADAMLYGNWTPLQDACFWTRGIYERIGGINPHIRAAADYDMFLRMSLAGKSRYVPVTFSAFRQHEGQLSSVKWAAYTQEREKARTQELARLGVSPLQRRKRELIHLTKMRIRARVAPFLWNRADLKGHSIFGLSCDSYWPRHE